MIRATRNAELEQLNRELYAHHYSSVTASHLVASGSPKSSALSQVARRCREGWSFTRLKFEGQVAKHLSYRDGEPISPSAAAALVENDGNCNALRNPESWTPATRAALIAYFCERRELLGRIARLQPSLAKTGVFRRAEKYTRLILMRLEPT